MKQPLVVLSLCLHVVWVAVFCLLAFVQPHEREPSILELLVGRGTSSDSIATAAELGRLDVVSISLTVLGSVLALAALASYFVMRHTVIQTTRDEAERSIPVELGKLLTAKYLADAMKSDPELLERLQKATEENKISNEAADDIAEAMDDEPSA